MNPEEDVIEPEQIVRWKIMASFALVLFAVVLYLYHVKVGAPIDDLESDVRSHVITQPAPADVVLSLPDEAPQGRSLPSVTDESPAPTATDVAAVIQCPANTTRMIFIDGRPLCCQDTVCQEAP